MSWQEFCYYINGLSSESPLGRIIGIRAETDPDVLKTYTPEMKKVRNDYKKKMATKKTEDEVANSIESIKRVFLDMSK